jgi:hypothetical protein
MQHIRHWWATPILLPRWVLTVKYAIFAVLGGSTAFTGVFDFSSAGLVRWFCLAVMLAALTAVVASGSDRLEAIERWACAVVVVGMAGAIASAIVAAHGPVSIALVVILILLTLLATGRLVILLSRLEGKK